MPWSGSRRSRAASARDHAQGGRDLVRRAELGGVGDDQRDLQRVGACRTDRTRRRRSPGRPRRSTPAASSSLIARDAAAAWLAIVAALEHQVGRRIGRDHHGRGGARARSPRPRSRPPTPPSRSTWPAVVRGPQSRRSASSTRTRTSASAGRRSRRRACRRRRRARTARSRQNSMWRRAASWSASQCGIPPTTSAPRASPDQQLVGAGIAPDPLLRECDELDRAQVGVVVARRGDALEPRQAADRVDVDVAAQRGRARDHRGADHVRRPARGPPRRWPRA